MSKFFKKTQLLTLVASSLVFGAAFADEESKIPTTNSNIELILKEKKNHLGSLLIKRFALVKKIAYHKWNQKIAIEDAKAEKNYLSELSSLAQDFNISPQLVEKFFSSQIEAQKAIEIDLFETWVEEGVHKHSLDTNLSSLTLQLKDTDIELLKNLQHSKSITQKNKDQHLTDLANQLKDQGYSRDVIDDSLQFMSSSTSYQ